MAFMDELEDRAGRVRVFPADEACRLPVGKLLAETAAAAEVYCCGPEGLIAAVQAESERLGRPAPHFERFSAAPAALQGENRRFSVVLARSGVTLEIGPGQSIADVLDAPNDEAVRERTAEQVRVLMQAFPLPGLSRVS